jgi:hypothetical protein
VPSATRFAASRTLEFSSSSSPDSFARLSDAPTSRSAVLATSDTMPRTKALRLSDIFAMTRYIAPISSSERTG